MMRVVQLALVLACTHAQRAVRLKSASFKLLHVSDAHIHPTEDSCRDVPESAHGCNGTNTSAFVSSVARDEQPDLIAFTGDSIDRDSSPAPTQAMDSLYGVAVASGIPWGASLGNHESEVRTMSRDDIYRYIVQMPGADLSYHGPVAASPGNFYVDLLAPAPLAASVGSDVVVARLVFFDSRDDAEVSINEAQLAWFANLTASLPAAPTLAFYHIPLPEYQLAVDAGAPITGSMNERICADKPNAEVFGALFAGHVVAGFCGHDHTNDFCVPWMGVQLCYEGSARPKPYSKPSPSPSFSSSPSP